MNDIHYNGFCRSSSPQPLPNSEEQSNEKLAALAKAIAHPVRIQILRILASHAACLCGDIVNVLPLAQSTVSEHLRILKASGLILGEVDGPRVCYCIDTGVLDQLKALILDLPCPDFQPSPVDQKGP